MMNLLLGISSGIACYKILDLVKVLNSKYKVDLIMTRNATKLVPKEEFEKALGKKVYSHTFRKGHDYRDYLKNPSIEHISLADKSDFLVIAPATANIIGKIAGGICDDLLTTTVMASTAPKLLVPSMNVNMWENEILQKNLRTLRRRGFYVLEPDKGPLLCGVNGKGRLPDIRDIASEIDRIFQKKKDLKGKKIVVSCGAISEKIDEVRIITNLSSGKTGFFLAEECALRGAEVTLICGQVSENMVRGFSRMIRVFDSADLKKALEKTLPEADVIFHAAAVPDFIPEKTDGKIKTQKNLNLKLYLNKKIIQLIKKINPDIYLVGFKAVVQASETELFEKIKALKKSSGADLVVGNDVKKSQTFGSDQNEVILWDGHEILKWEKTYKREIAKKLIDRVVLIFNGRH